VNGHGRLVVYRGREGLALLARNGAVGLDELGHHATHSLDTEGQRCDIEQHDIAGSALLVENSTLDRGTHGHHLVGVYAL